MAKKAWNVQVVEVDTNTVNYFLLQNSEWIWVEPWLLKASVLMLCKKKHGLHDDHNLSKLQSGDINQPELKFGFW